jgi:hypothetical protein
LRTKRWGEKRGQVHLFDAIRPRGSQRRPGSRRGQSTFPSVAIRKAACPPSPTMCRGAARRSRMRSRSATVARGEKRGQVHLFGAVCHACTALGASMPPRNPPVSLPVARLFFLRSDTRPLRHLFLRASNFSPFPPRRVTPKTLVLPPREKITLEFPTFRFFKTWDLRTRRIQKHPATRPSIPPPRRANSPRFPASTPPGSFSHLRFEPLKTGRNSKPALVTIRLR